MAWHWININCLIHVQMCLRVCHEWRLSAINLKNYLFGVLRCFQHCTGDITTGSWKGRGNQYIEFPRILYCKLRPTASNYQLSHIGPCYHSATVAPSAIKVYSILDYIMSEHISVAISDPSGKQTEFNDHFLFVPI